MGSTAFILPPKLSSKVDRIQKEMGLNEPGKVITKAIELLDISIGRKVILKDNSKTFQIDDLEDYSKTREIKPDGSSTK